MLSPSDTLSPPCPPTHGVDKILRAGLGPGRDGRETRRGQGHTDDKCCAPPTDIDEVTHRTLFGDSLISQDLEVGEPADDLLLDESMIRAELVFWCM